MRNYRYFVRKFRLVIPIGVIALLLGLMGWILRDFQKKEAALKAAAAQAGTQTRQQVTVTWEGKRYALREDLQTLVLLGTDVDSTVSLTNSGNPGQCDFVCVAVLDETNQRWTLLPINRDTICVVPLLNSQGQPLGTLRQQLALAHTYGSGGQDSCRNAVKAVENLLYGISADGYIRISLDSISKFNDAVGGATVTLVDDFSKQDESMRPGETITLTGTQAELFVRARSGMQEPTNLARMQRQRTYLAAWAAAAKNAYDSGEDPAAAIASLSDQITSNLSIYKLSQLCNTVLNWPAPEIWEISGTVSKSSSFLEFHPDEDALQHQILALFYEPVKE